MNKTLDFRVVELPVMHQGAFANSWAFSAVAVIEYLLAIVSNTKQPISTQVNSQSEHNIKTASNRHETRTSS